MAAISRRPAVVRPGTLEGHDGVPGAGLRASARPRRRCVVFGCLPHPGRCGDHPAFLRQDRDMPARRRDACYGSRTARFPSRLRGQAEGPYHLGTALFEVGCSSALAAAPEAGVQRVAEGVAEQVEGEHQQTDCQSGVDCQAGLGAHVLATLQAEHLAPAWEWRR